MKKLIAITAVLLTSAFAFAYPEINDSVMFSGTVVQGAQTIPVTFGLALVQFDAAQNQYLEQQTMTQNGGPTETQTQWVKAEALMNPDKVKQVLATCTQQNGRLEDVVSGTETFHACALPINTDSENSIYWIADVPFGIVKADISNLKDSTHTNVVIQSHSGK